MTTTAVRAARRASCARQGRRQFRQPFHLFGLRAETARMRREVDRRHWQILAEKIVERLPAARALQAVDTGEAAVVEHDDDELRVHRDRGRDL